MPKTEVILTSNIVGLGGESDHVKVAAGYARNYLFPQGLAVPVTAANKRRLDVLRQRRTDRESHEFNTMSELAKNLAKLTVVVAVKTGEDGKMFGSVTAGAIADELKNQFEAVLDKKKIHVSPPIRALGEYEVELHLHSEVKSSLKVRVESSTPLPKPELKSPADRRDGGPATGDAKRPDGRRPEVRRDRPDRRPRPETKTSSE